MTNETMYQKTGSNRKDFEKYLRDIAKSTYILKVSTSEISLFTVLEERDDKFVVFNHAENENIFIQSKRKNIVLQKNKILSDAMKKQLAKDKTFALINERLYFISPDAIAGLANAAGVSGSAVAYPSVERDHYIAKWYKDSPKDVTLICRNAGASHCIHSVLSANYKFVEQTCLLDIIEDVEKTLGKANVVKYIINHRVSGIYMTFPDKQEEFKTLYNLPDDIVPGLYLGTSETGDSSLTARGFIQLHGVRSVFGEYSHKHQGNINAEEFMKKTSENVFADYCKIPEALCDLMVIDIVDVQDTYKKILSYIDTVKAVGKKAEIKIFELLCSEINPELKYTAYDLIINIMEISNRIDISDKVAAANFEKATAKAPFFDFYKKKKEIEVTLLA